MGVPAFFRWLSRKYPAIVVHAVEEKPKEVDGVKIPVDSSQPNPNNVEFDNLYLDMNGIIHPCCHPENKAAPKDEDEMMVAIFEYIDRLISICRPRRLLYMAIDGVAPRAKMNQQRSRRFRASKEVVEKCDEIAKIRSELESKGIAVPPPKPKEAHFDSNCITPGTPFMDRLAKCLHYYIHDRLNNDPGWKNIVVILSDANVPGEGEHKIMDYIRRQRASPDHDPNTKHCLCGADADLIMLGLATHEPNFTIIREEFKPNQPRPCELCGQIGHELKECTGGAMSESKEDDHILPGQDVEFIFIRLNVLREYLTRELAMDYLSFPFDIERAIDDWVFMCFFVGNDFLPHLPSLEIREGAIDRLVRIYKSAVTKTGGFLTESGFVNPQRVQLIMRDLGEMEDEIFKKRQQSEIAFKRRLKEQKRQKKQDKPAWVPGGQFAPQPLGSTPAAVDNPRQEAYQMRMQADGDRGQKRKKDSDSEEEEEPNDEVRLWEDGFKDRYYESKFEVPKENIKFRYDVGAAYTIGLCWVLQYYYQGCASWKWYFPYHYAPFASDFVNIGDVSSTFEKGTKPFNPFEQLMSVFPAASRQHIPLPWGELLTEHDSPIIDFYPDDFKIDLNGKRYAWQGVALLPFVDEQRLLAALKDYYPLLNAEERKRNVRGDDRFYIRKGHPGYPFLLSLYESWSTTNEDVDVKSELFFGIGGKILRAGDVVEPNATLPSPIMGQPDLPCNQTVCVRFRDPYFDADFTFPAKRLPGAVDPPAVLKPGDLNKNQNRNWRPTIGMAPATQRANVGDAGKRMLNHSVDHARGANRGSSWGNSDRGGYRGGRQGSSYAQQGGGDSYRSQQGSRGYGDGYGSQPGYGNSKPNYGNSQSGYGMAQSSYGNSQSSYGTSQARYGSSQASYGISQSSYGNSQPSYGNSQSSYGNNGQSQQYGYNTVPSQGGGSTYPNRPSHQQQSWGYQEQRPY